LLAIGLTGKITEIVFTANNAKDAIILVAVDVFDTSVPMNGRAHK